MIILVGDTPSSVEINAGGPHWGPIQNGGRADTSAPIGSVSRKTCKLIMRMFCSPSDLLKPAAADFGAT